MIVQPAHTILAIQTGGQYLKYSPGKSWVPARF
jgi:hypothetical protein